MQGQSWPAPQGGLHAPAAPPGVKGRIVRPRLGGARPGAPACARPPRGRVEAPAARAGVDTGHRALQGPALCRVTARFLRPLSRACLVAPPPPQRRPRLRSPPFRLRLPRGGTSCGGTSVCPAEGRLPLDQPGAFAARSTRPQCLPPPPSVPTPASWPAPKAMQAGQAGAAGDARRDPSQAPWVTPSLRPVPVFRRLAGRELRA